MYVIITSVGFGSVPEWPKGADCKSVVFDFGGSNPPAPTKTKSRPVWVGFLFWRVVVASRNTASLPVFAVRRNGGCLNRQGETIGVRGNQNHKRRCNLSSSNSGGYESTRSHQNKKPTRKRCTLEDSKKAVWKFHTAFHFVSCLDKQGKCISLFPLFGRT